MTLAKRSGTVDAKAVDSERRVLAEAIDDVVGATGADPRLWHRHVCRLCVEHDAVDLPMVASYPRDSGVTGTVA